MAGAWEGVAAPTSTQAGRPANGHLRRTHRSRPLIRSPMDRTLLRVALPPISSGRVRSRPITISGVLAVRAVDRNRDPYADDSAGPGGARRRQCRAGRQELRGQGDTRLHGEGICSGRFLEFAFKTVEFKIKVTVTRMEPGLPGGHGPHGAGPAGALSSHRPHTLTKIRDARPNPLARARSRVLA